MAKSKANRLYAPEFRRQMVELVRCGRNPEELAREFEPSAQAIRNWVAQAEGSNSRASSSGLRPHRTSSTICRRNSGAYSLFALDFAIVNSCFPNVQVSTKAGQLHKVTSTPA